MKSFFLPFILLLLLLPFLSTSQDFFVEFQNPDYQQTEKLFLENMHEYIPQNADGTSERYIESMDPGFFEAWISWIMDEAQIPGASLCFLKEGQLYWKWHNGVANIAQGNAVNDSTIFLTCSISKTVIITAIMQLYEEGMFQLDDDINEYLPFEVKNPLFPDSIITFRYLMTHLSSINDNLELLNSLITYGHDCPIPISSLLEAYLVPGGMYFTDQSYAVFPPFQEHNYTNIGATLLAYLVERMTDTDFETYCHNHIFQPLGMEQTSFRLSNLDQSRIATPYLQHNGILTPTDHPGFPVYPSGSLRSSAVQLSKLLSMYMQGGTYEGVTILNANTVDLITTLQYPHVLWPDLMGLIWFFNNGFYKHGGYFPGAQSEYGFSWDRKSGMICLGNSASEDWSSFIEFLFISFSYQYEPFSILGITIQDADGDRILEPGETAELILDIKNNTNITELAENVTLKLTSKDSNISIITAETLLGDINYLDTLNNPDVPLTIQIGSDPSHYLTTLDLEVSWGDNQTYELSFDLDIGHSDLLLVNDATTFGGMFLQADFYYDRVLDSLGIDYYHYDLDLLGDPTPEFITNFPVVIWFTGYHNKNTLTEYNQEVLANYLDSGGNLFLSGQQISTELDETVFLKDYLHVGHASEYYDGQDTLVGIDGDPISDGITLTVNQGFNAMFQYSMSEIEPLDGGEPVLRYFSSLNHAAVRYESPEYKTVFFSFGFEGINGFSNRLEVMERILDYFNDQVGQEEDKIYSQDIAVFPNPVSSEVQFGFSLDRETNVDIRLFDGQGRIVMELSLDDLGKGDHVKRFDLSSLPKGVYFYRVVEGRKIRSGKIVRSGY